ncbi:hypothetical protein M569_05876, partial [Genlisea aurea]
KIGGGHVNKAIEIQGLEIYSDILENTNGSSMMGYIDFKNIGNGLRNSKCSPILSPLDISLALSVNRTGKLLNDAPQYTMNAEISRLVTTVDEIQLQHVFVLYDYVSLCELREKYGRYRPWWSPIEKRLQGWQKAWWHYAQESILSDMIDEHVQQELEELEKETDIDEILHYRSIAERQVEVIFIFISSEDDHHVPKPRGWLHWLSYGMLGAAGTEDSTQFSGVVSDDVIKDIYEATKFYPSPEVSEDTMADEVYFSSIKFSISEIHSTFRSNVLGQSIAEMIFEGISIESKGWDKTAIITASVNLSRIINPLNGQV